MSDVVIHAESLAKLYPIGPREPYDTLRDALLRSLRHSLRRFHNGRALGLDDGPAAAGLDGSSEGGAARSIWALKDVSFDVKRGEVVGIIGRNGAGKSTLLKILSRITEPTGGFVDVWGRVGSLLEVGTGFHRELTGRENIYLNGAILGMKKKEIDRKFDEMIAFAEIEKFLDTEVKRYSSGMYMRLAFSVAAHLEPEILLVDEVLAVGDGAFQKKCLGKIDEVARQGRTVLFVSHNMAAVLNLCARAILIDDGRIVQQGATPAVVDEYLAASSAKGAVCLDERADRVGNRRLKIVSFRMFDAYGKAIDQAISGQEVALRFGYSVTGDTLPRNVHVALAFHGGHNENLFHLSTGASRTDFAQIPPQGTFICRIPKLPLQPGKYNFNLICKVGGEIADGIQDAGTIEVAPGDYFKSGRLPPLDQGAFLLDHSWQVRPSATLSELAQSR